MKSKRKNNKKRKNTLKKYKGGDPNITYVDILAIFHQILDDGIFGKEGSGISGFYKGQFILMIHDLKKSFNDSIKELCEKFKIDVMTIDTLFKKKINIHPRVQDRDEFYKEIKKCRLLLRTKSLAVLEWLEVYHPDLLIKLNILKDDTDDFLNENTSERFSRHVHIDEIILEIYKNMNENIFLKIKEMNEKFDFSKNSIFTWFTFSGTRGFIDALFIIRPLVDAFTNIIKTGITFENVETIKYTKTVHKCESSLEYIMQQIMGNKLLSKMKIKFKTKLSDPLHVEKTFFIKKEDEGTKFGNYILPCRETFYKDIERNVTTPTRTRTRTRARST